MFGEKELIYMKLFKCVATFNTENKKYVNNAFKSRTSTTIHNYKSYRGTVF